MAGLILSIIVAPIFLGSLDSAFQYVQEYMGLFSPVILFVFLSAIFFKKSSSKSVLAGSLVALIVGVFMKLYVAQTDQSLIEPFMHQMAISFGIAFLVSFALSDKSDNAKVFKLTYEDFKTSKLVNKTKNIIFFDNIDGMDLYNVIKYSKKTIAFHGMMTNLASIEKKSVLD